MCRRILTLVLAAAALAGVPAMAQRVTGQVSGVVTDPSGGALPGVTVALTGENIVGEQNTATNQNGYYRFIGLPPGAYALNYSLDGFQSQRRDGVKVSLGGNSEENVRLEVGNISETITVTADSAVIDTSSNEIGINFDRDWVELAPVRRQSFNDLVAQAPGSLQGGETGFAGSRTMVYGSSYDENSFQIDGADVNDNFFNEQLSQPNVDAIEEIEVLSLGAPAEYGNLTGAVYNIVTRQGTNKFHGDANFFLQSDGLTGDNTSDEQDGGFPYKRDKFNDFTFQLGGPVAQDRLWFFASYQRQEDGFSNVGVDPTIGTVVEKNDRYFGKLNLQINPSHKLQFGYTEDNPNTPYALTPGVTESTAVTRSGTTPTPGIGYTGVLNEKTVLEVRFTGFYADVSLAPTNPSQPRDQARVINFETGIISGGHYYWYELGADRTTVAAKVSYLADDFLGGQHDFRFGVQYNESEASGVYGYNDLLLDYGYGYQEGYGYSRAPFSYSGNTEGIGAFVDDTWKVTDRLTLNLGVRYDTNDAFSKAQNELDENGKPTGVVFPQADYYTWDYISPRLGLNYQLTKDAKTVLKLHAGRYHRAIATGEFANVIGPSIKPIFAGLFDFASGQFIDPVQITDNSNLLIDPDYKSPRVDQLILSLERQLRPDMGLALNLVKKRGRDFAAWRDIAGVYDTVSWIDGDFDLDGVPDGTDPFATGNPITLFRLLSDPGDRVFQITNRDEMDYDVESASLTFTKRMTNRWSMTSSATYLKSEGRGPDSGGGASVQQRGGLQFRTFGRNPNDFVNTGGRLRGDIPFQFKTQFAYRLPLGFVAAMNLSHRDGANLVRRVNAPRDLTNISSTILAQERGTFGRLPSQTVLDLRLQKDFKIQDRFTISVAADIFNALNDDSYDTTVSSIGTSDLFLVPDGFLLPRRAMLSAKIKY